MNAKTSNRNEERQRKNPWWLGVAFYRGAYYCQETVSEHQPQRPSQSEIGSTPSAGESAADWIAISG